MRTDCSTRAAFGKSGRGIVPWKLRNSRLIRWAEYIDRFDAQIMHVEGEENKVADCLSRYYENDTPDDEHPRAIYVNADVRLNPELDELPDLRR